MISLLLCGKVALKELLWGALLSLSPELYRELWETGACDGMFPDVWAVQEGARDRCGSPGSLSKGASGGVCGKFQDQLQDNSFHPSRDGDCSF